MKIKIKILSNIILVLALMSPLGVSALDDSNTVIVGGEPFGIKMLSEGVMVVDTDDSINTQLRVKDIILEADGEAIDSSEELLDIVSTSQGGALELTVRRNQEDISLTVYPTTDSEGVFRLGVWVKDSAAGLGTVTFYDNEGLTFCGLGHGICESDTGELIPLSEGSAQKATVTSVTKNSKGGIGCLNGYFLGEELGDVFLNSEEGIYGTLSFPTDKKEKFAVADITEIEPGEAYIYTTIDGTEPQKFKAEITDINEHDKIRNLVITITDEKLLGQTCGIVQGMSGSPIIQNGKLIGAVTHVTVDDPKTGFGIFAKTMLENTREFSDLSKNVA